MQTTKLIWWNGKLIPWEDAKIHVLCHTLHYGGGAFEGIRFYNTERGPAIFRLGEHVDRLMYSANALRLSLPYSKNEIMTAIIETAKVNELKEGYIRPICFYGYNKMGVNPIGNPTEFVIVCWPWGAYLPERVEVKVSNYIRIHPRSTEVDAKLCGHYVNGVLASLELQGTHYHEALFLDDEGHISEGIGENFFIVRKGILYTPKLGTILPGITRDTIIKLARDLSIHVVEKDLTLNEAYEADEAFFTGTAAEVTPIYSLNDRVYGNGCVGPMTAKIKKAFLDIVHGKNPAFNSYLSFLEKKTERIKE